MLQVDDESLLEFPADLIDLDRQSFGILSRRSDDTVCRGWTQPGLPSRQERRDSSNEIVRNRLVLQCVHHKLVQQMGSREQNIPEMLQAQAERGSKFVGRPRRRSSIKKTMASRNGFVFGIMQLDGMQIKAANPTLSGPQHVRPSLRLFDQ